jgi:hypothetical protein
MMAQGSGLRAQGKTTQQINDSTIGNNFLFLIIVVVINS